MIYRLLIIFFLIGFVKVWGATAAINKNWTIASPPNKEEDKKSEQLFNQNLFSHFNQLQIVTTNPNSNIGGDIGDMLLYQATGSVYYFVIETSTKQNGLKGTTWSGIKLGIF